MDMSGKARIETPVRADEVKALLEADRLRRLKQRSDGASSEDHAAILRQGVKAWNAWRSENPGVRPILAGADLSGMQLKNANLFECDLSGANLSNNDLSDILFSRSNLSGANLSGADLYHADLADVDLSAADLSSAKLVRAVLPGARFSRARLAGADFRGARQWENALWEGALITGILAPHELIEFAKRNGAVEETAAGGIPAKEQREESRGHPPGSFREDQVHTLRQGAKVWNAWRAANPDVRPMLSGADLAGADLAGADLRGADLRRADLSFFVGQEVCGEAFSDRARGADLSGADLSTADLREANLTGVFGWETALWKGVLIGGMLGPAELIEFARRNGAIDELRSEASPEEAQKAAGDDKGSSLPGPDAPQERELEPPTQDKEAQQVPLDVEAPSFGGLTRIARSAAPEERCLNVGRYASVLSRFFRSAEGEFSFALLGPWGRGKTYLMELTEEELERQDAAAPSDSASEKAPKRYEVVWFSAWKYRSTPEVWVHLYETFAEHCGKGGWVAALACWARTWLVRYGYSSLVFGVVLAALASVPIVKNLREVLCFAVTGGVAVAALGHYAKLFALARRLGEQVKERFAFRLGQGDRLGLQAAIGEDLRSLLVGWMPGQDFSETYFYNKRNRALWIAMTAILALTAFAFLPLDRSHSIAWLSAAVQSYPLAWSLCLTAGYFAVASLVALLTYPSRLSSENNTTEKAFGAHEGSPTPRTDEWQHGLDTCRDKLFAALKSACPPPDRVLLVVDDLDRCDGAQMLEIIESLKLMLEDDALKQRVQQVVLVEEDALACAIEKKFGELATFKAKAPRTVEDVRPEILEDHMEKLFISHLRLGLLGPEALAKVARKHIEHAMKKEPEHTNGKAIPPQGPSGKGAADLVREEGQGGQKPGGANAADEAVSQGEGLNGQGAPPGPTSMAPEQKRPEPPSEPPTPAPKRDESMVYTQSELNALEAAVKAIGLAMPERWGPRSVRAFMFKYQLARMLLDELLPVEQDKEGVRGKLVSALQEAVAGKKGSAPAAEPETQEEKLLARIVNEVV